jgi:polar amino acid transport system permease protein
VPDWGVKRRLRAASRRHALLISIVSTTLFLGLLLSLFVLSPGSGEVRDQFASPEHFRGSADSVWHGFIVNIKMMVIAEALVLVFALMIAVVRSIPGPAALPLRMLAIVYTDFFRGIPLLLVVFMVGLGVPALGVDALYTRNLFIYGVVALVLVYSAYVTEVYRAGIESVHPSQTAAARSLGLSHFQTMRYVIIPQAVRRVIPPLLNDFIGLQKDTALISIIGVGESVRAATTYAGYEFNFTGYTVAAVYFLLLTIPLARLTDYLVERDRRKMRALGG